LKNISNNCTATKKSMIYERKYAAGFVKNNTEMMIIRRTHLLYRTPKEAWLSSDGPALIRVICLLHTGRKFIFHRPLPAQ
jgi:hypothetical protein